MNEQLSGILEEALSYANQLPFQYDFGFENSESCDLDIQNETCPSTDVASITQTKNVQLLNEFDAYNISTGDSEHCLNGNTCENAKKDVGGPNIATTVKTISNKSLTGSGLFLPTESYSSVDSRVKQDALKNLLQTQPEDNEKVKHRRGKRHRKAYQESVSANTQSTEVTPEYTFDKTSKSKSLTFEDHTFLYEDSLSSFDTVTSPLDSLSPISYPSSVSGTLSSFSHMVPSATEPEVKKKRRRKRESNRDKTPPPQILPPCKICDDKSSGFHYGANTCEACKGFFRRTLKKKEVTFQCRCTEEEKDVWSRGPNKNGCPACRYERCLAVGMSKNAIKIGRYTLGRKTENIKEVKSLEAMDSIIMDAITEATKEGNSNERPTSLFIEGLQISFSTDSTATSSTTDALSPLSALVQAAFSEEPPMKKQKVANVDENSSMSTGACSNDTISLKEIDTIVKTMVDALDRHDIPDIKKINVAKIKERQNRCFELYTLKTSLFGKMSKPSIKEFKEFYETTGLDLDNRLEDIQSALSYFENIIARHVGFAKSIPGFTSLDIDDQASLIKASRIESILIGGYEHQLTVLDIDKEVFVTPWGKEYHLNEIERTFPKEDVAYRHQLALTLRDMDLTNEERAVIRGIAVVATDRCELKEPKMAERIQTKLITCLQHLLSVRPGGPGTKLYKIFSFFTRLREFTHTKDKKAKNCYLDWPDLYSNFHLLSEFLR